MYVIGVGIALTLASMLRTDAPAPQPPREAYESLVRAQDEAFRTLERLQQAYRTAAAEAEKAQIRALDPKPDEFAGRFLELAKKAPGDPAAVDALVRIVTHTRRDGADVQEALAILLRDHITSEKLGPVCMRVGTPELRRIVERNPHRNVLAPACFNLAVALKRSSEGIVRARMPDLYEDARMIEQTAGKAALERHIAEDADALTGEAERLFERVIDQYGDLQHFARTFGEDARNELYELRHLAIGKPAPAIVGEDVEGEPLKLADFRGKVVVLTFWGTWCGPCMAMVPHERELVARLRDRPFVLLGVNSDADRDALRRVMAERGITWRSWWDGGSALGPIASKYNVHGWPTTYVLDQQGVIRFKDGAGSRADFVIKKVDEVVDRLLGGAGPSDEP
jgi:thiol-disulfide isomerase/thioredoxin